MTGEGDVRRSGVPGLSIQEGLHPTLRCFGCGHGNAKGLKLRGYLTVGVVTATLRPWPEHDNVLGYLNGGIMSTVLDCHSAAAGDGQLEASWAAKGGHGAGTLRSAVAAHAADLGARPDQVRHLVIIASELASNAVRHGGGRGRLRLWRVDGAVRCEVSDEGPGLPDPRGAGATNPPALALGGRGLWIVRRLSTALTIDSTDHGTTVTAAVGLAGEPTR